MIRIFVAMLLAGATGVGLGLWLATDTRSHAIDTRQTRDPSDTGDFGDIAR